MDQLAVELRKSIGMQLSFKLGGNKTDRGALLDTIDRPVTDALWVKNRISSTP